MLHRCAEFRGCVFLVDGNSFAYLRCAISLWCASKHCRRWLKLIKRWTGDFGSHAIAINYIGDWRRKNNCVPEFFGVRIREHLGDFGENWFKSSYFSLLFKIVFASEIWLFCAQRHGDWMKPNLATYLAFFSAYKFGTFISDAAGLLPPGSPDLDSII